MANITLPNKRLKIRAELHTVWRIDVNHLDLPAQALVMQQRVHYDERVPQDHSVNPFILVLIGTEDLVGNRVLRIAKQLKHVGLLVTFVPLQSLKNGFGREPLVNEQR